MIACLCGKQLQMAWLQRLPKIAKNTGIIGVTTPISAKLILYSPTSPAPSNTMSWLHNSLLGSGQAYKAETLQSNLKESRTLLRPYPRPSNFLENMVLSTGKKANTSWLSRVWWKATNDLTLHLCLNLRYWSQFHITASKQHYYPNILLYVPLAAYPSLTSSIFWMLGNTPNPDMSL